MAGKLLITNCGTIERLHLMVREFSSGTPLKWYIAKLGAGLFETTNSMIARLRKSSAKQRKRADCTLLRKRGTMQLQLICEENTPCFGWVILELLSQSEKLQVLCFQYFMIYQ